MTNALVPSRSRQEAMCEEYALSEDAIEEIQHTWARFLNSHKCENPASALYALLSSCSPRLASFQMPVDLLAMRFLNDFSGVINSIHQHQVFNKLIKDLSSQELYADVLGTEFPLFSSAIVGMIEGKLGSDFSSQARCSWLTALNLIHDVFAKTGRTCTETSDDAPVAAIQ
eukprot:TRINITY_DN18586_c0_g1_i1.p1 TRINITY_DN18586_c0_g1~~TRINITY_DN18586_c0_g1_i1.p1  ORF type:complete len:171 (-),score=30.59 TRINITY_DN18586_c0_g1_i1:40-552(-)